MHWLRNIAAILFFFLFGFIFPPSFFLAAVIAFQFFDKSEKIVSAQSQPRGLRALTADDDWQGKFHRMCESVAEVAFMDSMVSAFKLAPDTGTLSRGDLTLEMQVQVPPFRLDFLINKRLVVEIDGAAYHSSPEAIERDRTRDTFLIACGFEVLRIPAKVALDDPNEAINRVRVALHAATLRDTETMPKAKGNLRPRGVLDSVDGALVKFSGNLEEINRKVRNFNEQLAQRRADIPEIVAQQANARLKQVQDELDADPELRKIYDDLKENWKMARKDRG